MISANSAVFNRGIIRSAPNGMASRAASCMCRRRTTSLGGILDGGSSHHLVAEISAQLGRRAEIDLTTTKQIRKLPLQRGHPQITDSFAGLEFDEDVYVAGFGKAGCQH